MNKCFFTVRIVRKYILHTENKDPILVKILLKTPNIHHTLDFVYLQGYGFNKISRQIFNLSKIGEYLYLEGSAYLPINKTIENITQKYVVLLLLVVDLQPIF